MHAVFDVVRCRFFFGSSYDSLCASASSDDIMCYSRYPTRDQSIEGVLIGDNVISDLTSYLELTVTLEPGQSVHTCSGSTRLRRKTTTQDYDTKPTCAYILATDVQVATRRVTSTTRRRMSTHCTSTRCRRPPTIRGKCVRSQ